jgi:[ribosomal protein S18]-alanine N-acetyltransferase
MTPVLRRMRWWDVEAAVELERDLFPDDAWSVETFWAELARNDTRSYWVLEEAGTVLGYAGLLAVGAQADVQTMAVRRDAWGRGFGRRLLGALLEDAERRGAGQVLLEVRADNPRAEDLYARAGFERIAVRRNYYERAGVDAVVMRRRAPRPEGRPGG